MLVESPYGDRLHPGGDPIGILGEIISRTIGRGDSLIIPAFAVGRTQSLLYCLHRLRELKRIPEVPVYLNSPMAIDATTIFSLHPEELHIDRAACADACGLATPVQSMEQSVWLNRDRSPKIILAGSGMATGGRMHHLAAYGQDPAQHDPAVGLPGGRNGEPHWPRASATSGSTGRTSSCARRSSRSRISRRMPMRPSW
ncbi:Beta-Casp domain-containing protein (plasmid) [Cupriavidus necator H16]|uniref:Beta-Casp domain-containing protein n=1 Tax=Cupriavidus necator (strain ATCC 17699 / DSM 428 / KCTC 22496 / NCIMB 10442 / H16 / Stanier 337) TaxID=381666 RepID=Q7WXB1_CUPNH|nr:conserved hypothetical protein [Cupriavidus necator H16]